jgi:uncharacterized protein (TIRG00374 family)
MRKILSFIILSIILIFSIIFIRNNINEFSKIPTISFVYIVPLIILTISTLFINGLRIKLFGDYYGINLSINEWFGLSSITTMGNHMTPFRGGAAARAFYMKKIHNFSYTSFLTTIAASYVLRFFIYGLLGVILSLIIYQFYNFFNNILFLSLVLLTFSSLLTIIIFPIFRQTRNKFLNRIIKILEEWNVMRKNYDFLFKILLLDLGLWLIRSLKLFFVFKAFSFDIPFVFILLISVLSIISVFLSLTPAGLGVVEAVVAFSAEVVGVGFVGGLYASILDRIITVIVIFIIGPIFSYRLMKDY